MRKEQKKQQPTTGGGADVSSCYSDDCDNSINVTRSA